MLPPAPTKPAFTLALHTDGYSASAVVQLSLCIKITIPKPWTIYIINPKKLLDLQARTWHQPH